MQAGMSLTDLRGPLQIVLTVENLWTGKRENPLSSQTDLAVRGKANQIEMFIIRFTVNQN
jgi:hypothetical protein